MLQRPASSRRSPAPALRPAIHIDGQLHPALTNDLMALAIEHTASAPAVCTARFTNVRTTADGRAEYTYFGLNDLDFGRACDVWLGVPPATLVPLFEGHINLIEGQFDSDAAPSLVVQAEDGLQRLRMRSRTRLFRDATDAAIIERIASDHGLTASIESHAPAVTHAYVAQLHQSDLAFLLDRAIALGVMVYIQQHTLFVRDTGASVDASSLIIGEQLQSFTVRADVRTQYTSHGVTGWDVSGKELIAQSASDADLPTDSVDGRSGAQALTEAFGPRLGIEVDVVPASDAEADAFAAAAHRTNSAGFVTGSGVAAGVPGLRVGHTVDIAGVGALFSGRYQVVTVRHLFDHTLGFRTEFDVRRPRIARPRNYTKSLEVTHADRDQ